MTRINTLYISNPAKCELSPDVIIDAVKKHERNDWGFVDPQVREQNEIAIHACGKVVSVFASRGGARYKVISQGDRTTAYLVLESESEPPEIQRDTTRLRMRTQPIAHCLA